MNEARPIVTYHGNQNLFLSLRQQLCQGLPKHFCEWRRSYGRPPRSVYLDVTYVPYDDDILPDEDEKTLVSRPYFHIYWTDCDLDSYKQTVKDDIADWQAALKSKNIQDWLIVVVTSDESKVKAKLLPRSSVMDKVKSDFCSKYSERCIALTDPLKLDSKSSESWSLLFERLRPLLLQAFNQVLQKYEDIMRSRREKRNEPGWNYFSYFIFQEELAFMLEILGLKEDALIQYDELDAMFDQFVENHANGKAVKWLAPLMEPCTSWTGVSLVKSLDLDLREEVKMSNVSLLEFRNYLFSRQAALLFQMHRTWEVAQRAMGFLYHTVAEMKALEVEIPNGAMACWVFLSCLEVLNTCTKHIQTKLDKKFAVHTANLWDFAHKKLSELGHLCSLMPGLVPTSEQLSLVVDLVSGMVVPEEESLVPTQKPVDKLRESLSSPEAFKKHYLELCEQAMGTYKYIGRFRSSRMIGREIADFYVKINEPQKAESFFVDAIRMYQQEGWHQLADGTMKELAQCQKMLKEYSRYVKTACHIACSLHLALKDKDEYFDEFVETLKNVEDDQEMRASQAFFVDYASLDQSSVCINDTLTLNLHVINNFPKSLTLDDIQVSIVPCSENEIRDVQMQQQQQRTSKPGHKRTPSTTHFSMDQMANFQPVKQQLPSNITLRATVEHQKRRVASCGITCDEAHALLKRTDSTSSEQNVTIAKGDYSIRFKLDDVTLQPGSNSLSFSEKITQEGPYKIDQMCFTIQSLHLLKPLSSKELVFKALTVPPQFVLKPKLTDHFISGIEQDAILTFTSGSHKVPKGSAISFTSSPPATISKSPECEELFLPPVPALTPCDIPVLVRLGLKAQTPPIQPCKLKMKVDALEKTFEHEIQFVNPFQVTHKTMTAGVQKFIQVAVHGQTTTIFSLSHVSLSALDCPDVELVLMNPADSVYPLSKSASVMFLWKLNISVDILPALDLMFSCQYSSSLDMSEQPRVLSRSFTIEDFQTQYIISYDVSSVEEDKACMTGESAILDIKIKQAPTFPPADGVKLAYTVKANGSEWAIGGKSSGMFTMKEGKHNVALDVVPMQPGHLHFPLVTLYKYTDLLDEQSKSEVEDSDDWDNHSALLKSPAQHNVKERSESTSSSVSHSLVTAHLLEFSTGQVYNQSINKQVHITPCKTNANIDVSLIQER